jgi:hypothetical protein
MAVSWGQLVRVVMRGQEFFDAPAQLSISAAFPVQDGGSLDRIGAFGHDQEYRLQAFRVGEHGGLRNDCFTLFMRNPAGAASKKITIFPGQS